MVECPYCGSKNPTCIMRMYPIFVYRCECGKIYRDLVEESTEAIETTKTTKTTRATRATRATK